MQVSKKHLLFTSLSNVRIDDINFGAHLCHSRFVNIIHNIRALYFKQCGFSELDCFDHAMIMTNLSVEYLSQCFFNDNLEIHLYLDAVEKATFSLSYAIFNHTSGKLAARAITRMGFIDVQTNKLKRVPRAFSELLHTICTNSVGY